MIYVSLTSIPLRIKNLNKLITKLPYHTKHKKIGQKKFFTQLIKLDPLAKRLVLPSDTQRSMRAYEVKKFTNKSLFILRAVNNNDIHLQCII